MSAPMCTAFLRVKLWRPHNYKFPRQGEVTGSTKHSLLTAGTHHGSTVTASVHCHWARYIHARLWACDAMLVSSISKQTFIARRMKLWALFTAVVQYFDIVINTLPSEWNSGFLFKKLLWASLNLGLTHCNCKMRAFCVQSLVSSCQRLVCFIFCSTATQVDYFNGLCNIFLFTNCFPVVQETHYTTECNAVVLYSEDNSKNLWGVYLKGYKWMTVIPPALRNNAPPPLLLLSHSATKKVYCNDLHIWTGILKTEDMARWLLVHC